MQKNAGSNSIDEYIAAFPPDIQKKLQDIRAVVRAAAPEAEEKISYQMPAFFLKGNLVYFAVHKQHIGFYPAPSGIKTFAKDLAQFKHSKGAVQFPLDKPMPLDLIARIVKYRVAENLKKAEMKTARK
ncbi:MAG: DUF1801 domain-containing protein [Chloroflexota bacterium]